MGNSKIGGKFISSLVDRTFFCGVFRRLCPVEHILKFERQVYMIAGVAGGIVKIMASGAVVQIMAPFAARFHGENIFHRIDLDEP